LIGFIASLNTPPPASGKGMTIASAEGVTLTIEEPSDRINRGIRSRKRIVCCLTSLYILARGGDIGSTPPYRREGIEMKQRGTVNLKLGARRSFRKGRDTGTTARRKKGLDTRKRSCVLQSQKRWRLIVGSNQILVCPMVLLNSPLQGVLRGATETYLCPYRRPFNPHNRRQKQ